MKRDDSGAILYLVKEREGEWVLMERINGKCNMRLKNNECRCTCKPEDLTKIN